MAPVCEPDGSICGWCNGEGMVREDHPDRPAGHDGCTAAAMPCENPNTAHGRAHARHAEEQARLAAEQYPNLPERGER